MKSVWAVLLTATVSLQAQTPAKFDLSIDNIMRGPAVYGYAPRDLRWAPDGKHAFFSWKESTEPIEKDFDTWVVDRDGKNLRKLSDEEKKDAPPNNGRWTRDHKRALYTEDGDIYLYDGATNKRRNLTKTTDGESSPRWTRDERHVAFVRGNNLYVLPLDGDGEVAQMTNIAGSDEKGPNVDLWQDKDKSKSASQIWVEKEERKLIETVDRRAKKREADEAKKKRENPRKPFKLEGKQSVADLELTPDGKSVLAFLRTDGAKAKRTIVPDYVTESGYTEPIPGRTKVGDDSPVTKLVRLDVANGESKTIDFGLNAAPEEKKSETETKSEAKGEAAKGETKAEAKGDAKSEAAKAREIGIEDVFWSEDGSKGAVVVRSNDNKDRWVMALDPAKLGEKGDKPRLLATMHDDAWVNNFRSIENGWLKDNETIFYVSEQTGWAHLYTVPWSGGAPKALTEGKWEVQGASLSNDGKWFDLTTSEGSLHEHHFWRMAVTGGARTRITGPAGFHEAVSSEDGTMLLDLYSYTNKPPEVYVQPLKAGAPAVRVNTTPSPSFATYPWIDAPIVEIPASDGTPVPARFYKPAQPNGAAVVFVHGAGYLQNVHRGWSSYEHEYLFHHFLMSKGFTVLDLDYRGSAGYGRDWRTAIYRHMGGRDLDDQVDAAKWLVAKQGIDAKRIGIYGGSYGGFITLMAMFTRAGTFAAGAALRPVTDWAAYNAGYTSNILNNPQGDPDAYRQSSPIYFAEGLKGALLMCHGVVDTNVHFQDTVRLAQRLIELHKPNWNVAMFPVENHGFVEAASWADEYRRIYELFEANLNLR
jgi:dipeptidyl aminopeptidase/acylaminoacyl peptidase